MMEFDGSYLHIYGSDFIASFKDFLSQNNYDDDYEIPNNANDLIRTMQLYIVNEYTEIIGEPEITSGKKDFSDKPKITYNIDTYKIHKD